MKKLKNWWNKNVKPYGAEVAATLAAGVTLVVTQGNVPAAIKVGNTVYKNLEEVEQAKAQQKISQDEYNAATELFNKEEDYLRKLYVAQQAAYSEEGRYIREKYKEETGAYAREGQYLEDVFQSEQAKANALRAFYKDAGEITDTERDIMDRQQKIIEEGDPMANQLYQEELSRVTGAIRGQGTQGIQRAQGQAIQQGLEGSIVARDLVRQTDRDTLKLLSETARDMALKNQREQMGFKRDAQGRLDRLNLSVDDRKRTSLFNLANITDPVKGYQGEAPVQLAQGAAPVQGIPGIARPVDRSGLYEPDYFGAALDISDTLGNTKWKKDEKR